jgi:hypothetical protein
MTSDGGYLFVVCGVSKLDFISLLLGCHWLSHCDTATHCDWTRNSYAGLTAEQICSTINAKHEVIAFSISQSIFIRSKLLKMIQIASFKKYAFRKRLDFSAADKCAIQIFESPTCYQKEDPLRRAALEVMLCNHHIRNVLAQQRSHLFKWIKRIINHPK